MTIVFFSKPTAYGAGRIADSIANGTPIVLAEIAVGDGDHLPAGEKPDGTETELINEWWRDDISAVSRDESTPTLVKAEVTIPTEEGGSWIKEIGVYDSEGYLFAIGKCPPSYKPIITEGSPKPVPVRFYLNISVGANLTIFSSDPEDPASISYVLAALASHEATPHTDFEAGNIVLLGTATPPTGWTKVADWTDNSMIVFTTGDPVAGGTDNPTAFDPAVAVAAHAAHTHVLASHLHNTPNHMHNLVIPEAGWGSKVSASGGRLRADPGAGSYVINGDRTLTTPSGGGGNTGYSGVLTTGNPSATLSHGVSYNSYAPKYRAMIAIIKDAA